MESPSFPPVIVIGMHRSGTSMITRLLDKLGLFMGKKVDKNHEALFFFDLNEWLLSICGATWDHPEPIRSFLEDSEARALARKHVESLCKTPNLVRYLGWRRYITTKGIQGLDFPWGWKDPRNTFTLPFWLDLFPKAKVIHVERNGIDVAHSLQTRSEKLRKAFSSICGNVDRAFWLQRRRREGMRFMRCASLEDGYRLWELYVSESRRHVRTPGIQAMEIQYEDFLAEPKSYLKKLASFVGLEASDARLDELTRDIDSSRAYAYRKNPTLCRFAERISAPIPAGGAS